MRDYPVEGEKYRHFKGKEYGIVAVARHAETGEDLVIYQALDGEKKVFAREVSQFLDRVDQKKYPDATQIHRFERIELDDIMSLQLAFFDAESYSERLRILERMQDDLTDVMLDNMALSIDVTLPPGEVDSRYMELRSAIMMKNQFENHRMR